MKDPTEAGFLYVLNNILRTRHYGAQTTRTGRVRNELIGVIFADGEIVSNLRWTQKIYDLMIEKNQVQDPDPLNEDHVLEAAQEAMTELMAGECIPHTDLIGESLQSLLSEVKAITSDETQLKAMLTQANVESTDYAQKHIFKPTSEKGKKGGKKAATASVE